MDRLIHSQSSVAKRKRKNKSLPCLLPTLHKDDQIFHCARLGNVELELYTNYQAINCATYLLRAEIRWILDIAVEAHCDRIYGLAA